MSSTRQTDKLNVPTPGTLITTRDGCYVALVLGVEPPDEFYGDAGPDGQWIIALVSTRGFSSGGQFVLKQLCLVSTLKHLVKTGQWRAASPEGESG